jgi:hypothetical protein
LYVPARRGMQMPLVDALRTNYGDAGRSRCACVSDK